MRLEVLIEPSVLEGVNKDIADRFQKMDYRPTVVVILQRPDGRVLFVQSAKNAVWWDLIQGGVNKDEEVITALQRELFEETGIGSDALESIKYCGVHQIAIESWERKDGFLKGKRYYNFLVKCKVEVEINLQESELAGFDWVLQSEVYKKISSLNGQKQNTILTALHNALKR